MLREINKQTILEDDEDIKKFLEAIERYKKEIMAIEDVTMRQLSRIIGISKSIIDKIEGHRDKVPVPMSPLILYFFYLLCRRRYSS